MQADRAYFESDIFNAAILEECCDPLLQNHIPRHVEMHDAAAKKQAVLIK